MIFVAGTGLPPTALGGGLPPTALGGDLPPTALGGGDPGPSDVLTCVGAHLSGQRPERRSAPTLDSVVYPPIPPSSHPSTSGMS